ncbi:MAG: hypothetical protein RLZZ08_589 [Pseudomonadota bacterium]|jgi:1-acyl-sn-glycerol-3-phosphate acyltransferase
MTIIRNIAFWIIFYTGSVVYVLSALALVRISPEGLRRVADGWSGYHRACVRHILRIRVEIEGAPLAQPAFYALKHESFFEAIDLPTLLPRPAPFAKVELFSIPGWGAAAKAYGLIAVDRDQGPKALRRMITEARASAAAGRALAMFPEGTRVPHGDQPPLKSGFVGIYKLLGLQVVPVAVASRDVYHRRWKKPGVIRIRFGAPIPPGLEREDAEARVHAGINALNA